MTTQFDSNLRELVAKRPEWFQRDLHSVGQHARSARELVYLFRTMRDWLSSIMKGEDYTN